MFRGRTDSDSMSGERRRLRKWDEWYIDRAALDHVLEGEGSFFSTSAARSHRALDFFFQSATASASAQMGVPIAIGTKSGVAITIQRPKSVASSSLPAYLRLDALRSEPGQSAFLTALYYQCEKANSFFVSKISELQTELQFVQSQVEQSLPSLVPNELASPSVKQHAAMHNPNSRVLRSTASLQRAVADLYRQINDLDGFCLYNTMCALDVCTNIKMMRHQHQQTIKQRKIATASNDLSVKPASHPPTHSPHAQSIAAVSNRLRSLSGDDSAASNPVPIVSSNSGSGNGLRVSGSVPASSAARPTAAEAKSPDIRLSALRTRPANDDAAAAAAAPPSPVAVSPNDAALQINADPNGMDSARSNASHGALRVELIVKSLLDRMDFYSRAKLTDLQTQGERVYASAFTEG